MIYSWMNKFTGGRGRGLFGCEKEIKIRSFSILKPQQGKGKIELEGSLMILNDIILLSFDPKS